MISCRKEQECPSPESCSDVETRVTVGGASGSTTGSLRTSTSFYDTVDWFYMVRVFSRR